MSDIKIIEKNVAPTCCWTTITHDHEKDGDERCAYKIVFDRAYPYFWISGVPWNFAGAGIALTKEDIARAAASGDLKFAAEEKDGFAEFDLCVDGILTLPMGVSLCVAVGARKSIYLLVNPKYSEKFIFTVSAQEDSVCPFVSKTAW